MCLDPVQIDLETRVQVETVKYLQPKTKTKIGHDDLGGNFNDTVGCHTVSTHDVGYLKRYLKQDVREATDSKNQGTGKGDRDTDKNYTLTNKSDL
jgi:hypothetical protein